MIGRRLGGSEGAQTGGMFFCRDKECGTFAIAEAPAEEKTGHPLILGSRLRSWSRTERSWSIGRGLEGLSELESAIRDRHGRRYFGLHA